MPNKKYGYEAALEASYSASSNTNSVTAANAGNLLGLSGNMSFINRNFRKEGIKMSILYVQVLNLILDLTVIIQKI